MSLTDKQLQSCFGIGGLSDHNGSHCGRRLRENGIPETEYVCQGKTKIVDGKLVYEDTCGEPCSFICKDADAFRQEIERLQFYEKIIERAKS